MSDLIAIAALTARRVIGAGGTIPWHLPGDLKFFKRTTLGHVVLMGRKTYDSIGKPLPGRENWVLSRSGDVSGVRMIRTLEEIPAPPPGKTLFLIGGSQLYTALLPRCRSLLLTHVDTEVPGDTYFPDYTSLFDDGTLLERGDGFEIRHHHRRG